MPSRAGRRRPRRRRSSPDGRWAPTWPETVPPGGCRRRRRPCHRLPRCRRQHGEGEGEHPRGQRGARECEHGEGADRGVARVASIVAARGARSPGSHGVPPGTISVGSSSRRRGTGPPGGRVVQAALHRWTLVAHAVRGIGANLGSRAGRTEVSKVEAGCNPYPPAQRYVARTGSHPCPRRGRYAGTGIAPNGCGGSDRPEPADGTLRATWPGRSRAPERLVTT